MHSILIVDDEAGIRQILARWLAPAGYALREVASAEAALVAMSESAADAVLCDIEMPGHGGLWLTAQLRDQYPRTAIILATAVDTIPPTTSFQSGIIEYLVKPFVRERVLMAVASAVEWHVAAVARPPAPADGAARIEAWMDADDQEE